MASNISYMDCCASFGAEPKGVYRSCLTAIELVKELDRVGVDEALVYHALMRHHSPAQANAFLSQEIADQPRLTGTWALLPPQTGELALDATFFQSMAGAKIRALWAFPQDHRYILDRLVFGEFLDQVAERRIPVFLPPDAAAGGTDATWQLAYRLLGQYPQLTLVVAGRGPWGEDRFFMPLLEQFDRFYLDISRYELDCGIEQLVSRYGPKRLLYGSSFPRFTMGGPRLMVARAAVSEEARKAIAGGNLRRLLAEVELS